MKPTVTNQTAPENEVLQDLSQYTLSPILNRGTSLKSNLEFPNANVSTRDTVVENRSMMLLRIRLDSRVLPDLKLTNVEERYFIGSDSTIKGIAEEYDMGHLHVSYSAVVLSGVFADTTIPSVENKLSAQFARYRVTVGQSVNSIENDPQPQVLGSLLENGSKAPGFLALSADSNIRIDSSIGAMAYLLEFEMPSCLPCLELRPSLDSLSLKYARLGARIISVRRQICEEQTYLEMEDAKSRVLNVQVSNSVVQQFGVSGFPTCYLLDSKFHVFGTTEGFGSETVNRISKKLDGLLGIDSSVR